MEKQEQELFHKNVKTERLFSGIQPTGELHIGNYLGAVKNWVSLIPSYDCIYCIVDLHAITIDYKPEEMPKKIFEMAIGLIASGVDPEKCTLFVQSSVSEHTELTWIFNTIISMGELSRMTQFKDKSQQFGGAVSAGLFDYPVLQTADILLYKAKFVPVGEDQLQHIELSREIARNFNRRFKEIFPEPKALLSEGKRILGLDGKNKMSKSLGNHIALLETPENIWKKLKPAVTDTARVGRYDKGDPEVCNIFTLHTFFTDNETQKEVSENCREAKFGCIDCKKILSDNISLHLLPIREKARELNKNPEIVRSYLFEGAKRCKSIAKKTMREIKEAVGLTYPMIL